MSSACKPLLAYICICLNAGGERGAIFLFNGAQPSPLLIRVGSGERAAAGRAQPVLLASCYRCVIAWTKPGRCFPRIWRRGLRAGLAARRGAGSGRTGGGCAARGASAFGQVASVAPLKVSSGIQFFVSLEDCK